MPLERIANPTLPPCQILHSHELVVQTIHAEMVGSGERLVVERIRQGELGS
jgi:hypothetical protein